MRSRRQFITVFAGGVAMISTGCLWGQPGSSETSTETPTEMSTTTPTAPSTTTPTERPTETPTETCVARDPPEPTDAATAPRPYPDQPAELTTETVEEFLETYESAYQYNDQLAANPDKIGRTTEIIVSIRSVTVTSETDGFTAEVTGRLRSDFIVTETPTETPEPPTETPLPIMNVPIDTHYTVTERRLIREGVVLACW